MHDSWQIPKVQPSNPSPEPPQTQTETQYITAGHTDLNVTTPADDALNQNQAIKRVQKQGNQWEDQILERNNGEKES